jgi:hypothetical protein
LAVARTSPGRVEFVVRGKKDGRARSWLYRRQTDDFQSDRHGEIAPTLADVIAPAALGDEFTVMLVPEGSGVRIALDRDGDGYFDTTEIERDSNPADPESYPFRMLGIARSESSVTLTWESVPGATFVVQWRASLATGGWNALGTPLVATNATMSFTDAASQLRRFYRVRMEP